VGADAGAKEDSPDIACNHFADLAGLPSQGMGYHGPEHRSHRISRNTGQEFSFIGNIKRVEAKQFAGPGDIFADRQGFLKEPDTNARLLRAVKK
jgi:hypothetical protein